MCNMTLARFATLAITVATFVASCAKRQASDSAEHKSPVRYSSPADVFNAYREARSKRDWRKCFHCLTPEAQKDALFETYFACGMSGSKEVATICEKFIDGVTLNADYEKRYKEKHGMSIAEVRAKEQTEEPRGPTATSDRDLLVEALNAQIQDKVGFYEAALNLLESSDSPSPIGDLGQMVIEGDSATGAADIAIVHYEMKPGEPEKRVDDKVPKTFKFRKVNGGWLIK
jgi:hypothetical protein